MKLLDRLLDLMAVVSSRRPKAFVDPLIVLPLVALMLFEIYGPPVFSPTTNRPAVAMGLGLVGILPLALRRVAPLPSFIVVMGAALAIAVFATDFQPFSLALAWLIAIYTVAAHEAKDRAFWGLVIAMACVGVMATLGSFEEPDNTISIEIFLVIAWGLGRAIRSRELAAARISGESLRRQAELISQVELTAAQERTRIARELHDVVAHGVSVMVVQAGAAQRIIERDPGRALDALAAIENAGRAALVELRRLLGVIRADGNLGETAPQPGLHQVGGLIDNVRDADVEAALHIEGERRELSAGADLAAYRIVQEALTNVVKHAAATRADVWVRYLRDAIELQVVDNGRGPHAEDSGTLGHGLIGMRERAALFGGAVTLSAGATRGTVLRAYLPTEAGA